MPDPRGSADSATAPAPQRVVFFGDSRADWWRPLPQLPGVQCRTCGLPGASAGYLLQRFRALVTPLRPEIVVVQMGVNDLVELTLGHRDRALVAMTGRAIAAVVGQARDLGARVVFTTIFPLAHGPLPDVVVQRAIAEVNRTLLGLRAAGVQVLDSAAVLAGPDGYVHDAYADDELHLSAAGYAALNVALEPMLED